MRERKYRDRERRNGGKIDLNQERESNQLPGDQQFARDGERRLGLGYLRHVQLVSHHCHLTWRERSHTIRVNCNSLSEDRVWLLC